MQALVTPKNRRPKFELTLRIIDLSNVPLVSGTSFVKWHLPRPAASDQHGRTAKSHIKDHRVAYDYSTSVPVHLHVDRHGVLQEHHIQFEVLQEYGGGAKSERITLGHIKLNLAEYVDSADQGQDGEDEICRRYLMQDSRINSTLKIGIAMRLIDGERNFVAPRLNIAPVFGGIAGIVAGEQAERDDGAAVPSISNKARETGETQDLYRQNLAAYWTAQPGELKADECIENIFAGGDGWGHEEPEHTSDRLAPEAARRSYEGGESRSRFFHRRDRSRDVDQNGHNDTIHGHVRNGSGASNLGSISGRSSLEQHAKDLRAEVSTAPSTHHGAEYEIDEFEAREDLRSWRLPGQVF